MYLSDWNGAYLAIISQESVITEERLFVLDIEVVDNRKQAEEWFSTQCGTRPWEGWNDKASNTSHIGATRQ